MEVKLAEASYIQNEIQNEHQYIVNLIERAPAGLRDELQAMLDKRKPIIESIQRQIEETIIIMPEGTERYIAQEKEAK